MVPAGYFKKYVILEELDTGFGIGGAPEGFARFEGNRNGITLTLQIRRLREGTAPYTIILIYEKNNELGVLRAGSLDAGRMNGIFRRNLDYGAIHSLGMDPANIKYILIAAEHRERIFLPMVGICGRSGVWDESIRQRLLKKESGKIEKAEKENILSIENYKSTSEKPGEDQGGSDKNKIDTLSLERKLKEMFENIEPFLNPRHDYAWYKINDLAKLSNILFACNMKIPLFANPKILVGLFKYRHLIAGIYRSDRSRMNYFVLGIPAKDDSDGKPFEKICRWVGMSNPEYGDMSGYWLVYINLANGEFAS
ncbi:MAG TPA: hypothetical protein DCE11_05350 [Ruminiclostridium sp.]|nr:hypothetical protein [Clostridiaceae bacterium]HAA25531.1 hypothetical protein [Ruminiclostridium sp.]